jgi:CBS domain containing-hemolysin-like protein
LLKLRAGQAWQCCAPRVLYSRRFQQNHSRKHSFMEGSETTVSYGLRLLLVLLLVLANGFFVATEFALVGMRRSRAETLAASGNKRALRLLNVLDHLDSYISATQLGITLASLALGWVGEQTLSHMFEPLLARVLPAGMAAAAAHTGAVILAFTLITFLHIVLGELAPKTLALQRAEAVSLAVARPMQLFYKVFKAPIWVLNEAGNFIVRLFGLTATGEQHGVYTAEELRHVIDVSRKGGQLRPHQGALLSRSIEFSGMTVREAMIPRTEVVAIHESATLDEVARKIRESGYSRLPVYRDSLDDIIGVVHGKEMLEFWGKPEAFSMQKLMRPAFFVPDTVSLEAVLRRMQDGRFHFAIVTDEHGGLEGVITLEDLLEEIVGEIEDEFDEEQHRLVTKQTDGSYLLAGSLPLRSANRRLGLKLPEDESYHTLAGFLMAQTGSVMQQGDKVNYDGVEFIVERADRHRIKLVKMTMKQQQEQ